MSYNPNPNHPLGRASSPFGALVSGVEFSGAWGVPGPGGPSPSAPNPGQGGSHSKADALNAGIQYRRVPVYPPFANLALDPNVVYLGRMRSVRFGGNGMAAQTFAPQPFQFSIPTIMLARSGGAYLADDSALPVGRADDTIWAAYFQRVGSNDLLDGDSTPTLARCSFGTGASPTLYPGNGVFFDRGSSLFVYCQSLVANAAITITIWCLEEYANLGR